MQITNTMKSTYEYSQVLMKKKAPGTSGKASSFSEAVTKVEQKEEGKRMELSLIATAIGPELCGITATLLDSSTPDNPIVQLVVSRSSGDEIYNIEINKVNPQNASELEMFALCGYADVTGKGSGYDLGSYNTLSYGAILARYNGYTGALNDEPPTWEQFANRKLDWTAIGRCSVNAVKNSKDMKQWEFALLENKLLNYFADHFKKTSSDLEDVTKTDSITDSSVNVSMSETVMVQAKFPLEEVDEKGNPKEDIYMIAVDKNGIRCTGKKEYEWEILFTEESQYEKAKEFLNFAGELMDNFRFAAHKNFWEDYLNGNMAVDEFKEFLKGTNNGIPDYFFTAGDSTHVDREKAQWAKYMNPFGAKFFTAEEYDEMLKRQVELFRENIPYLNRLSTPYSIIYKQMHPEYNGERIFCEYPGGPLYTADEIMEVMNRNAQDAEYQAKARGEA